MTHPYQNLSPECLWYKSMSNSAPGHIDPVTASFKLNNRTKIATMGSCFAQHLAKFIKQNGFNYYVTEPKPFDLADHENTFNYGVFTARYGNIYTVKQALQLLQRAYSEFHPIDGIWKKDNVFIDAFRPNIQPNGFESENELKKDRVIHLSAVRQMFEAADVIILTLGLTEGWESTVDGACYPLAPGVFGGQYYENNYKFINYRVNEVIADLDLFVSRVQKINPEIKILLTVSPVPLIATKEDRHVLVSTTVSKSILRVAADEIENKYEFVTYFPSYEIITSSANSGKYYESDLREVTDLGVSHVMRVFKHNFLDNAAHTSKESPVEYSTFVRKVNDLVCDEELILKALSINRFTDTKD